MEKKSVVKKQEAVEKLAEKLGKAKSFYIVDYTGLDANAMNALRGKFRSGNFEYFVTKNSILERASERLGFEEIREVLAGPNSISISYDDPIGPARIINDHYKETELPTVKLCCIEGKWFSSKEVRRLADLPSREVLLSQVLNLMNSPMSRFVGLISNLLSGLLRVIDGVREKRQDEQPAVREAEQEIQVSEEKKQEEPAVDKEKEVAQQAKTKQQEDNSGSGDVKREDKERETTERSENKQEPS
jgi:large subunit ribosomal protein L10